MSFNGIFTAREKPACPSFGLFSVASVREHGYENSSWVAGAVFESDAIAGESFTSLLCTASDFQNGDRLFDSGRGLVGAVGVAAFNIVHSLGCDGPVGAMQADEFKQKAVEGVKKISEYALELELVDGAAATNFNTTHSAYYANARHLNPTGTLLTPGDFISGSKFSVTQAIAALEDEFYRLNPTLQGTVHLPVWALARVRGSYVKEKDGVLRTRAGSLVTLNKSLGSENPAAVRFDGYISITGPVYVELGAEELITTTSESIHSTKDNSVRFMASRPAAVYFDGRAAISALVDATL